MLQQFLVAFEVSLGSIARGELTNCCGSAVLSCAAIGTVCMALSSSAGASEIDKLIASDRGVGDQFGFAVSVSGDTAVVGARQDDDDGASSGSAYVFRNDGMDWVEEDNEDAREITP